jgi:diadenosine tetraphosphate (Ap4A) HIT family hydrolase
MSCLFCEVVAGRASATRIYENEDYLAIPLVFPKRHTVDLTEQPAGDVRRDGRHRAADRACRSRVEPEHGRQQRRHQRWPCRLQSVMHIHLHVVPRRNGDKLSLVKGMMLRRDPNLETTGRILREALKKIDTTG